MLKYYMNLDFRGWIESRRAATVHPEIKKWIDSADKLKHTVEKLAAALKQGDKQAIQHIIPSSDEKIKYKLGKNKVKPKDKEPAEEKPDTIKSIDFEKLRSKFEQKPDKKIEPKNVKKPTKVEKDDEEKGSQNDKQDNRLDLQRRRSSS